MIAIKMMANYQECCKGCAKGLLLVLNGFCILIGLCTFGFAVVDSRILKQYGDDQTAGTLAGDMFIVVASLLIIMVAVFGSVGAATNSVRYLYLYVGFLMMMVMIEMLIAIFVSVQRYGLEFRVTDWIREDFFKNVTEAEADNHQILWDEMQIMYECCGLNGPEDYPAIMQPISISCCPRAYRARTFFAQKQLYKSCLETETYYTNGCEDQVLYALRMSADSLIGAAILCLWFEGAGILLAMSLANNLKNSVQVYKHTVKY